MQVAKKAAWHGGPETCVSLNNTLSSEHRAMLEASGISPAIIADRGYRTAKDKTELQRLGFSNCQCRVPGLLIPICGPAGDVTSYQFRPDNPRRTNGKEVKYESLPSGPPRLDVPPTVLSVIGDPSVPLWITEGVKKADSAVSAGLNCLALLGVWNFKGKNAEGGSAVIGDFDHVALKGRTINIAFDSDTVAKPAVNAAGPRLAGVLKSKGAKVLIRRIPPGPNGEKVGLDDYLAAGGAPDALHIVELDPTPQKEQGSTADRLVTLAQEAGVELWHDEDSRAYATCKIGDWCKSVRLESMAFELILRRLYKESGRRGLSDQCLKTARQDLLSMAVFDGPEHRVELRIGWEKESAYLALHDKQGTIIEASAEGLRPIPANECPVRFVGNGSVRPLPMPTQGGSFADLWPLLNCEEDSRLKCQAWLVGVFLPAGEFPVLVATGEEGSGKTFAGERLRALVDPSKSNLKKISSCDQNFLAGINSGYVVGFDNVSHLTRDQSDTLCMIASGTGLSKKQNYTDGDEYIVETRRPMILTGISDFVESGDLADRTLSVRFLPLRGTGARKATSELLEIFDTAAPGILGAILDAVCRAFRDRQIVEAPDVRLLDFAQWAIASCPEEERPPMYQALERNSQEARSATTDNDPLFPDFLQWLEGQSGSVEIVHPGQLLGDLMKKYDGRPPVGYPKSGRGMGEWLDRRAPDLRDRGYQLAKHPSGHTGGGLKRIITKSSASKPESTQASIEQCEQRETSLFEAE